MGTRCEFWGDPEREFQPWALCLFTFKDDSSSDGLPGSVRWQSRPLRGSPVDLRCARQKPTKKPPG
jgi:hypothetical protein